MTSQLPDHLKKYQVEQNYEKYTALDQATWRFIVRQLKQFLAHYAHPCYLEGLAKSGLSEDSIPKISSISQSLEKFGWTAIPVSGFIPPAAFMELQSLSVLPIASDMRSIEHLLYTPAPDIVHEAAGHAPILIEPEYALYLKKYAQVAKKALISKEDLDIYEAIRNLSDLKENSNSTQDEIDAAEVQLKLAQSKLTHTSEASQLSRMNWWTAEYGLIGDINQPKIFGAGLLSSVGESRLCLTEKVKKISLSVDCINQSYDITEPQPQLYVARDFNHLVEVLEEFSNSMAFKTGGVSGLVKAQQAKTVNTIELDSKIQISGLLTDYFVNSKNEISFLKFSGPTQICFKNQEIPGHNKNYHSQGYSTPLGPYKTSSDLKPNNQVELHYESGVIVKGQLIKITELSSQAKILTFQNAQATFLDQILFQPDWGLYDIVTGFSVESVFAGPADRVSFGDTDEFVAKKIEAKNYNSNELKLFSYYSKIRNFREQKKLDLKTLNNFFNEIIENYKMHWLLFIDLLEIVEQHFSTEIQFIQKIKSHLEMIQTSKPELSETITDGVNLIYAKN